MDDNFYWTAFKQMAPPLLVFATIALVLNLAFGGAVIAGGVWLLRSLGVHI